MNALTRLIIASIMVMSTLALHYPSYRVVAELLIHNENAGDHSTHRHGNHASRSTCETCPDCSGKSKGPCHRIGCCDSIPSFYTFEQHDYSLDLQPASYQSPPFYFPESRYQTTVKTKPQRGPPEFFIAHYFISLSHAPNAPPPCSQVRLS